MNRKAIRRQVETAVAPILTKGEQLQRSGPAWALEQRGRAPLLFRARDLHEVVLTDQRLILLTRPRRRRPLGVNNVVLAKRYSTFSLERARRLRPLLQLRVRTSADRVLVLEFRPRDRGVARDLAAEMGPPASDRTHPATPAPEPVRVEPPAPEPERPEPPAPEPEKLEPLPEPVRRGALEPVRFEPAAPEASDAPAEKLSRREKRRARKEENERRQARKDRKQRNRGSDDIDVTEQLRQ